MSRKKKIVLSLLAVLLVFAVINRRWVAYVAHLARHQLQVVFFKEKITERLKRDLKPEERRALETTLVMRDFIEKQYGLRASKSYRYYYDLKRKALGFNITVAPALSLKPESFRFFPVGSFDYLGFFDKDYARAWADEYRKQGFDTHLAEIGGYSTLGWFEDPLYSSQLDWGETGLALLLGHEIAHEKLYFKNDTTFSELLASFIEKPIARDYLAAEGKPVETAAESARRLARRRQLHETLLKLRGELEKLYASGLPAEEKLRQKRALIGATLRRLEKKRAWFGLKEIPEINNASLAQLHRYSPQGKAFENLLKNCRRGKTAGAYTCWFAELEKLKSCTAAQRKKWLEGDGVVSAETCKAV